MRTLGMISLVQLLLGILGARHARAHGLVPEVPGFAPRRKRDLARREFVEGTALSAPGFMLVLQAAATALVLFGRRTWAARTLGVLGALMTIGYPVERAWRESFVQRDAQLLPFTAGGFVLALKMAILGFAVRTNTKGP